MYQGQESEYYQAKQKAAKRLCRGWTKPSDLPSNREIRDEVQILARLNEGPRRTDNLREMRFLALHYMQLLEVFRPRLIGSVLTGFIRSGSDIDLHVFSDSVESIAAILDDCGLSYAVERKLVTKNQEQRIYTHIQVQDRWPVELTVYPSSQIKTVFKSSITGKPIERASISQLHALLESEYPHFDIQQGLRDASECVDRFQVFESLLLPLENVKQDPYYHPEGDALYHSLQVFDLARKQAPYDQDLLIAALMHDCGKAIDRDDHVNSGVEALAEWISSKTEWLIVHHMDAHKLRTKTLGARGVRRLTSSPYYTELLILQDCDQRGRMPGYITPELAEAINYLREIE